MAKIRPSSTATFYSGVPMADGYQIVFRKRAQQQKYFEQHTKFSNVKCSYIRRTGQFRAHLTMAQARQCNYMSFINPDPFENILYYAVITDVAYVNPNTVLVSFEVDAYQTYYDNVKYSPCVIQRQHMSVAKKALAAENPWRNDIPELCTVEDSGYAEMAYRTPEVRYDVPAISHGDRDDLMTIVQVHGVNWNDEGDPFESFKPIEQFAEEIIYPSGASKSGKLYLTLPTRDTTLIFIRKKPPLTKPTQTRLRGVLNWLTLLGLSDNIGEIFEVHRTIANMFLSYASGTTSAQWIHMSGVRAGLRNEKLYRAPYQYLRVDNRDSGVKEYKFEMSDMIQTPGEDGDPENGLYISFTYIPFLYETPRVYLVPYGYHSKQNSYKHRMEFADFQPVPWSTDSYFSLLATNHQKLLMAQSNGTVGGAAALTLAKGATTGGVVGGVSGAAGAFLASAGSAADVVSTAPSVVSVTPASMGELVHKQVSIPGSLEAKYGETVGYDTIEGFSKRSVSVNYGNAAKIGASTVKGVNEVASSAELARAMAIRYGKLPTQSIYSGAKDVVVANIYNEPTSGSNILPFLSEVAPPVEGTMPQTMVPGQYTFELMRLRDSVLEVKDDWFDLYGYACGYRDLPLVVTYSLGADIDKTKIPTFAEVDHRWLTYVKCENMHVDHAQSWVADAISALFNSGCWFLDGERMI